MDGCIAMILRLKSMIVAKSMMVDVLTTRPNMKMKMHDHSGNIHGGSHKNGDGFEV